MLDGTTAKAYIMGMTTEDFRTARKTLGLTQAQFAKMLGYSGKRGAQVVSDIERSKAPITPTVERLVVAYLSGWRPNDWPNPSK